MGAALLLYHAMPFLIGAVLLLIVVLGLLSSGKSHAAAIVFLLPTSIAFASYIAGSYEQVSDQRVCEAAAVAPVRSLSAKPVAIVFENIDTRASYGTDAYHAFAENVALLSGATVIRERDSYTIDSGAACLKIENVRLTLTQARRGMFDRCVVKEWLGNKPADHADGLAVVFRGKKGEGKTPCHRVDVLERSGGTETPYASFTNYRYAREIHPVAYMERNALPSNAHMTDHPSMLLRILPPILGHDLDAARLAGQLQPDNRRFIGVALKYVDHQQQDIRVYAIRGILDAIEEEMRRTEWLLKRPDAAIAAIQVQSRDFQKEAQVALKLILAAPSDPGSSWEEWVRRAERLFDPGFRTLPQR